MERNCNKEEAIRAKEIAEEKMKNKDFVGARKLIQKAEQLFPDLENISLMLSVCDVHCSAEHKVFGSDMDWYGILQIVQTAEEASITKNYRKLARLLHPDKNKFPGAEAAFQMIGKAKSFLLNSGNRSVYDMKYSSFMRITLHKQSQPQPSRSIYERKQQEQQMQSRFSNGRPTFWTACPFCKIRYQYYRDIVNRTLRCQSCTKPFIGHDLDAQESLQNGNDKGKDCKNNGKEAAAVHENKGDKAANESESNVSLKTELEVLEVPDSDFYDFGRGNNEEGFAVGQTWAIYDDLDGMPRFYARIREVYSPGFKVQITWLEPYPDNQDDIDWTREGLPIACGKFRRGKIVDAEVINMFSHRVDSEKGNTRRSYRIYPRKGETWALFKNWDIKWSSNPDNHRDYQYEFVQVLSDYTEESGISVAYLVKVKGFVSLFNPTINNRMISFQIPSKELLRFSHRVPSFRTTGREREDVPEGFFELDPASLPSNLEEIRDPVDVKVNVESIDAKSSGFSKSRAEDQTKKSNTLDWGNSKSRDGSSRLSNGWCENKPSERNAGQPVGKTSSGSDQVKSHIISDSKEMGPDGLNSNSSLYEIAEEEFYNFVNGNNQKSQPVQIWSRYDKSDEIYPRKGEVWALYRNFNSKFSSSDRQKCEYDMVEVLEDQVHWTIVLVLQQVSARFETVFMAKRKAGHELIMAIPWFELFRFSHQVPAFRMTEERYGSLRGWWVLDPKLMPTCFFSLN